MKRIIAALKGKVENVKMERKINRVNRAIESATDNARDAIDRIEEEKSKLMEQIIDSTEVNGIINRISEKIAEQEEQEATIERLDKIKAYVNEEIEVEED